MHPFMAAELPDFDLEHALKFGMVPLITMSETPSDTLAAYASLYLEQEAKAEGPVRQTGSFARFLETVSVSHGGVMTLTRVARDAAVNRKTVEGFVEVLEDLLVSFKVPVFTKRGLSYFERTIRSANRCSFTGATAAWKSSGGRWTI